MKENLSGRKIKEIEVEFEDVEVVRLFCWEKDCDKMFPEVEIPEEHSRLKRCIEDHRRDCYRDLSGVSTEMLDLVVKREHTEWDEIGSRSVEIRMYRLGNCVREKMCK